MSGPDDLYQLEVALLVAAEAALATTITGTPGRVFVSPGAPALDCNLVAVWWSPITREANNPGGALAPLHQHVWINLVQLNILVARCIPTSDETGNAPPVGMLNASSQAIAQDAWALNEYISRRFQDGSLFAGYPCREESMSAIEQLAPSGGMGGCTLSLIVSLQGYPA